MLGEKERWVCKTLEDFILLEERVQKLRTRLKEQTYKITTTYSLTGGIGGNGFSSKVETAAIREIQTLDRLRQIEQRLQAVTDALDHAPLTETEIDLAHCLISGQSLASYARSKGIYISNVYKKRDKMLKKMIKYIENRTK